MLKYIILIVIDLIKIKNNQNTIKKILIGKRDNYLILCFLIINFLYLSS
jgi:hypothetical protein